MTDLNKGFSNLYSKANNIDTVIEIYNVLATYKEFDIEMTKAFIKILRLLQDDLVTNIDILSNDFMVLQN